MFKDWSLIQQAIVSLLLASNIDVKREERERKNERKKERERERETETGESLNSHGILHSNVLGDWDAFRKRYIPSSQKQERVINNGNPGI